MLLFKKHHPISKCQMSKKEEQGSRNFQPLDIIDSCSFEESCSNNSDMQLRIICAFFNL